MLKNQCLKKLINLKGINFKSVDIQRDEVRILVENPVNLVMCSKCSRLTSTIVDVTPRVYRDLDFAGRCCYIEIDLRRFECKTCFHTFTQQPPFAQAHRRYTSRFEEAIYKCCRETTGAYTAKLFIISDKTATEIYHSVAKQKQEVASLRPVTEIGVDEIAMHKGHQDFVLIITDFTNRRVLEVLPDRKKATLEACMKGWSEDFRLNIRSVAVDLWGAYRSVAESLLPNAIVVADRFHVMMNLNKALDACRKQEKRKSNNSEVWKNAKYAVLRNQEDLGEEQARTLESVLNISPTLQICYDLKERFRAMFNTCTVPSEARKGMHAWILDVIRWDTQEYYRFVKTLLNWEDNVLNYFLERMSSGFVEGVNNKIKLIKRKAFGFCNFENFRTKVIDCFS